MRRHNVVLRRIEPLAPLSVGNGEFAFTVDVTGLQTFPEVYEVPLNTLAQWGWHSARLHADLPHSVRLRPWDSHGRKIGYPTEPDGQQVTFAWHRANPHRLHLAKIGFQLRGESGRPEDVLSPSDLRDVEQVLDLWSGVIVSRFTVGGVPVRVETCCHPQLDALAVSVESPLIAAGQLAVRLHFPHPDSRPADLLPTPAEREDLMEFRTDLADAGAGGATFLRTVDADRYAVRARWLEGGRLEQRGRHTFAIHPPSGSRFDLVCGFSPTSPPDLPNFAQTRAGAETKWERFWMEGAALELEGSRDRRARELERRVVLSQYLTAINSAGSLPPAETGLFSLSWHGKFHLEMHWWHAAHFALWNRIALLERSLDWYRRTLPVAQALAQEQGFPGARWPKMVGPEGRQSPSAVAPLLIWQQPHPIAFAELCYRAHPAPDTLERYKEIVFETARFMASFAWWDGRRERYTLGPPLIPAQEVHPAEQTWNPTFELAYWAYGLRLAQEWRRRLALPAESGWEDVLRQLSPLPQRDGTYLAHENAPQTFTERNRDHPSMLAAFGVLPGERVDWQVMRRTLRRVMAEWRWDKTWAWDYPMMAMTAARLHEPQAAVDALMMDVGKNQFLVNGHNRQGAELPVYLPANGALLLAVALMAGGWEGGPDEPAPGFPADGSWTVRAEGFQRLL